MVDSTLKHGVSQPIQPPHAVRRRGLLADPRGGLLRHARAAVSRAGRARHELLRPADAVTDLELVMDLSNGRYLALGLQSEEPKSYDFGVKRTPATTNRACWSGAESGRLGAMRRAPENPFSRSHLRSQWLVGRETPSHRRPPPSRAPGRAVAPDRARDGRPAAGRGWRPRHHRALRRPRQKLDTGA